MRRQKEACRIGAIRPQRHLPTLRVEIEEAAQILRISRSRLYQHIKAGRLSMQKDGARSLITVEELRRFVAARSK
jgi:excisionase family DNA binding protein